MRGSACGALAMMAALALPAQGQTVPSRLAAESDDSPPPPPTQVPYTATYQVTTVWIRGEVSHTTTAVMVEARDSHFRTFRSTTEIPHAGAMYTLTRTYIEDPVAQTRTDWLTGGAGEQPRGQVRVLRRAAGTASGPCARVPAPRISNPTDSAKAPEEESAAKIHQAFEGIRAQVRDQNPQPKTKTENLGVKTIKGIEVRGRRVTITSYSAVNGPSETVLETWYETTPGLGGLKVLDSEDGPERKSRKELMSITLGEPDLALFKPPEGLPVVDRQLPGCPAVGEP